jgi:RimJ/RimL family protein N-acetyltransferase
MNLINVYDRQDRADILYRLLGERDETINVTHTGMPCYGDHVRYVESRPYECWYFIEVDGQIVGACYVTKKSELGIFIFKQHQGSGYGPEALRNLMWRTGKRKYIANINPRNERSAYLFSRLGFVPSQVVYELIP